MTVDRLKHSHSVCILWVETEIFSIHLKFPRALEPHGEIGLISLFDGLNKLKLNAVTAFLVCHTLGSKLKLFMVGENRAGTRDVVLYLAPLDLILGSKGRGNQNTKLANFLSTVLCIFAIVCPAAAYVLDVDETLVDSFNIDYITLSKEATNVQCLVQLFNNFLFYLKHLENPSGSGELGSMLKCQIQSSLNCFVDPIMSAVVEDGIVCVL
mmetsp:Transcript_28923/g.46227  ORF Transcript_28923/g.46227 Transcript_28923/m.46227 type:complete len:211 (-) Transcript_28923:5570-6202(-)